MGTWIFEPGHTAAEFRARHMMVTWVRGLFKDVLGTVEFDAERCMDSPRRPPAQRGLRRRRMSRIGFEATTRVNRHDFGVSWQDEIAGGGVVAGNEIDVVVDVEAILLEDVESTGAIEHYRSIGALPEQRA
jgi:polyisoprenoid-binding protein YceI